MFFKRIIDFLLALMGFVVLLPIFISATIGLYFVNEGKPFFYQKRPGYKEKKFKIIKFKTMNDKRDIHGNLLSDEERLTNIGKIVRKLSIDEIPQLINVLKGEMSIIGPRPLLMEYLSLYNDIQKKRHDVKPGITGLAQINGRNTISWSKKFEYDVYYVEHVSLLLDLKIFFLTIKKVLIREGISQEGHVTSEHFKGN